MKFASITERGKGREVNEDFYHVDEENGLYIVADGMGGHNAGEMASSLCVRTILEYYEASYRQESLDRYKAHLLDLIKRANEAIYKQGLQRSEFSGMGTTTILVAIQDQKALVFHVGDSRAYHIRKDVLTQLTTDHTLVQALYENGDITLEETYTHPQKNVITRAIGTDFSALVDSCVVDLEPEDRMLLCSDGLSNFLKAEELTECQATLEQTLTTWVMRAIERGSKDDITAVLLLYATDKECEA